MSSHRFRTRSLTIKVTDAEYAELTAAAGSRPLGEWSRSVLFAHLSRASLDELVVSELWATQAVVLTALARLAADDRITFQSVRQLKESVSADKLNKARQLLRDATRAR
jgi:hypothetical protein